MDFCGYKTGDTRLIDVPQLSGRYGVSVAVKDESQNEASGTFKDRRNIYILGRDSNIEAPVWYVTFTSGNSGLSMGRACQAYSRATGRKRNVLNVVDSRTPASIKQALMAYGEVHEVDGRREIIPNNRLDEMGRELIGDRNAVYRVVERANPASNGYGSLAAELFDENADFWFCPVGEGELMTQLALSTQGMKNPPKIIGVTINDNVFASGRNFDRRVKKSIADKLVTPYSDFRSVLTELCKTDDHMIMQVSDREITQEYEALRELGIKAEPSAAAAFAGAMKYAKDCGLKMKDRAIVINTGSGIFELPALKRSHMSYAVAASLTLLPIAGFFGYNEYQEMMERHKMREYMRQYRLDADMRLAEKIENTSFYRNYVAFARFKELQEPDITKREEVFDRVMQVLEMNSTGGIDLKIVQSIPSMKRVVDEYYEWLRKAGN